MAKKHIGSCRYCGKIKTLINAHILPKAFYTLSPTAMHFTFSSDGDGRFRRSPKGIYDSGILCKHCDGNVIGVWDQYAAQTFLVDDCVNEPHHFVEGAPIYKVNRADSELTQRFVLSVIWRASVSTSTQLSSFALGAHETEVLAALQSSDPTDIMKYPSLLIYNSDRKAKPIIMPGWSKDGSHVSFCADRFLFAANFSERYSASIDKYEVVLNKPVLAIGRPFGETPLASKALTGFHKVAAKHGWPRFPRKSR